MAEHPVVLVLDDDAAVRTALERRLQSYGYAAATAATIDGARTALGALAIEAVILDVGLDGGESGLELLDTVRARPDFARTPILVFTGRFLSAAEEASIRRHRAFLFRKPEGFDALVRFLDTLTGRDQAN